MVDTKIQEFHGELLDRCNTAFYADIDATVAQVFLEKIGDYLEEDGDLSGVDWNGYEQTSMSFSGYAFDEQRGLLTIAGCQFFGTQEINTLTKARYTSRFKKLKAFLEAATDTEDPLHAKMAPNDDACESSRRIYELFKDGRVRRIRFLILTDGRLSQNTKNIPGEDFSGIPAEFQVYDIMYLYNVATDPVQPILIDLPEDLAIDGLPYLEASVNPEDYTSYLAVMPAETLSRIYDVYGQRLLEQNVRTFLQLKGNTNKGMMNTVKENPKRFFAYNNGLTCTATKVSLGKNSSGIPVITKLEGLQIVNGGQTSSVLYRAYRDKLDISSIFVQMKLSVVNAPERYDDFVAKVARSANSQNPVKESDFFSNSPFHKAFKDLSGKVRARPKNGEQISTRWYYERTRGQYANEKSKHAKGSKAEKEFTRVYPKEQVIDKHLLAKSFMPFIGLPRLFAKINDAFPAFTKHITETIEKNELSINEAWFKEAVAKVIILRDYEAVLAKDEWVKERKSVRAYIKAYAVALLVGKIESRNKFINFMRIWDEQRLSPEFIEALAICLQVVKRYVSTLETETDLRERFRKEATWNAVREYTFNIPDELLARITVTKQEIKTIHKEARQQRQMDDGIAAQKFAVTADPKLWAHLCDFFKANMNLCGPKDFGILESMATGKIRLASEAQSKILYRLYLKAQEAGANV